MAANTYILKIPQPCHEDWQQMRPEANGRYCLHCAKNVVDFTKLSDDEVINLLHQHGGKLCGRFNVMQLNRALELPGQHQPGSKLKEIFAALLLLLGTREAAARLPVRETTVITPSTNRVIPANTDKDSAGVKELKGRVLDDNHEPLVSAYITNKHSLVKTSSDEKGNFTIEANPGDNVEISYLGFERQVFVVKDYGFKDYQLFPNVSTGLTVVEVIDTKHMPLRQRLKYKIRHFFHMHPKFNSKT